MLRAAVFAVVLALIGAPVAGIACGLGCLDESPGSTESGCHEHDARPTGPGLSALDPCDHDAALAGATAPLPAPAFAAPDATASQALRSHDDYPRPRILRPVESPPGLVPPHARALILRI